MGVFFTINGQVLIEKNKNKVRTLWGWKASKNKDIEPQRNFTGSHKKSVISFNSGILQNNTFNGAMSITINRVINSNKSCNYDFIDWNTA